MTNMDIPSNPPEQLGKTRDPDGNADVGSEDTLTSSSDDEAMLPLKLLKISDVIRYLQVSDSKIDEMRETGEIKFIKFRSGMVRFRVQDILDFEQEALMRAKRIIRRRVPRVHR